jgi:capsular exopolysaccharide synthesis family protein
VKKKYDSNDEFLFNFAYTLFKRKYLILVIFFTTFFGVILGTYLVGPLWEATAKVQIQANPKTQLSLFGDMTTPAPFDPDINPANNLIQVLTSRSMAEAIVVMYHRDELLRAKMEEPQALRDVINYYLRKVITSPIKFLKLIGILDDEPENYFVDAVEELQEDLMDVELEEETEVLNVSVWGENPEMATQMANTMVARLKEKVLDMTRDPVEDTYVSTLQQFGQVEKELHEAQDALRTFKEKTRVVQMEEEQKALIFRLDEMENELTNLRSGVVETEERVREAANQLEKQAQMVLSEEVIADNPIVLASKAKLSDLEAQVAATLLEKTEFHPDVAGLNAEIAQHRDLLKNELARIIQSETKTVNPVYESLVSQLVNLEVERFALKGREKALSGERERIREELNLFPAKEMGLARLTNLLEIKQNTYSNLKAKLDELAIMKETTMSSLTLNVIDDALVYEDVSPDWPKWVFNIPAGLIGSLLFGIGFAFLVDYWDRSYRTVKDLEEDLELAVVGSLPDFGKKYVVNSNEKPEVKRAFDKLVDALLLNPKDGRQNIYLITSSGPGEGKTTTAINLARALSERGKKALLVDADLRNPMVGKLLNVPDQPGLTDVFVNDLSLAEVVRENGISVLPAGNVSAMPPFDVFNLKKCENFFKEAASLFDIVIIDTPAIKEQKDPLALGTVADHTLLLVQADSTQRRSILMAQRKMAESGLKFRGIILNKQHIPIPPALLDLIR